MFLLEKPRALPDGSSANLIVPTHLVLTHLNQGAFPELTLPEMILDLTNTLIFEYRRE